jgi:Protein of unknown function (DUF3768)
MTETAKTIAEINDRFRMSLGLGSSIPGKMVTSAMINAPLPVEQDAIFTKVRQFNDFRMNNDFYGQHNFGDFDYRGSRVLWQIDQFAPVKHGGDDPADLSKTFRVLTIMFASEQLRTQTTAFLIRRRNHESRPLQPDNRQDHCRVGARRQALE